MKTWDWMLLFKRACMLFCGLFLLALGVVWMLAASYACVRYVLGPLVALLAFYYIWQGCFGSKRNVEDL